jgi:transposase
VDLVREDAHYGTHTSGFTPEYEDEAVKLVINTGRTVAPVARELGLKEQTLGRWVHDFRARAAAGEAGQGGPE